ncbi:hypothetical protein Tsp_14130, partial [Trichinella spiralis]
FQGDIESKVSIDDSTFCLHKHPLKTSMQISPQTCV